MNFLSFSNQIITIKINLDLKYLKQIHQKFIKIIKFKLFEKNKLDFFFINKIIFAKLHLNSNK